MITSATIIQLKAYARQDGLLLALLWTLSFALSMYVPQSVLGTTLALATPFLMGWRLSSFRDGALGGVISFRRAWAHCFYSALYASLAFALVQYVYFRFLDGGAFLAMLNDGVRAIESVYEQNGLDASELSATLGAMQQMTPVEWTFSLMLQNMLWTMLAGLLVAAICMKRAPRER